MRVYPNKCRLTRALNSRNLPRISLRGRLSNDTRQRQYTSNVDALVSAMEAKRHEVPAGPKKQMPNLPAIRSNNELKALDSKKLPRISPRGTLSERHPKASSYKQ